MFSDLSCESHSTLLIGMKTTNLMLVLIMLVFVIGEFPTTLNIFYATFLEDESPWIVSANGVNIWVYIDMSKQFRDSLFQLFSCCKHKQQGSESIGSNIITISTSVM